MSPKLTNNVVEICSVIIPCVAKSVYIRFQLSDYSFHSKLNTAEFNKLVYGRCSFFVQSGKRAKHHMGYKYTLYIADCTAVNGSVVDYKIVLGPTNNLIKF